MFIASITLGLSLGLGIPFALIIGVLLGWYLGMRMFKKQMKDNPPINEKQIRYLYSQIGRKPSEKQLKQIMRQFNNS